MWLLKTRQAGIGGERDSHPAKWGNCAKISKTTQWLIGQGPHVCKQDFSHNSSTESHAALVHFTLIQVVLPGNTGENKTGDTVTVILVRTQRLHVNIHKHAEAVTDNHYCDLLIWYYNFMNFCLNHLSDWILTWLVQSSSWVQYVMKPVICHIVQVSAVLWFISWSSYKMTK